MAGVSSPPPSRRSGPADQTRPDQPQSTVTTKGASAGVPVVAFSVNTRNWFALSRVGQTTKGAKTGVRALPRTVLTEPVQVHPSMLEQLGVVADLINNHALAALVSWPAARGPARGSSLRCSSTDRICDRKE
jgi:hypothetical protein